jgi:ferredoxin
MTYLVYVDEQTCIGCGACTAACNNFEMRGDKAASIKREVEDLGCNQDAMETCPVHCIKIEKITPKSGK